MIQVNIHEAKTNFSKLVDVAMHGEDVVIAKAVSEPLYLLTADKLLS